MSGAGDRAKRVALQPPEISCTGKVEFDTREQAMRVTTRHARTDRPRRSAYRCPHCHKWHVGTDVGRVERRRSAQRKRELLNE